MRTIAHVVNPVNVNKDSDLFVAQPVTFETMRAAKQFSTSEVDVTLYYAAYPEDRMVCPDGFEPLPDLDRSIMDVNPSLSPWRKLPLLVDILDRLYNVSSAEYMIYSNVDIALQPYFYLTVARIIDEGYDAFVINRRTITDKHHHLHEIPLMCAQTGEAHPGHDCFVFRRNAYANYIVGSACIGVNWVGRVLLWNLLCYADRFREFKELHATFHIGNDKVWKQKRYSSFEAHNRLQAQNALKDLVSLYGPLDYNKQLFNYVEDVLESGENDLTLITQHEEPLDLLKQSFHKFIARNKK
jgi:hypothetical protein